MHPPIEPFERGMLPRPGGVSLYYELSGDPVGKPAVYLHGGPGSGLGPGGYRRRFDPAKHLIVGLDQRGCGRSTPSVVDDLDRLDDNTTQALVADLEALREHLSVERWLVHGVSWGSTLALAYAVQHRDRVSELVLTAVTSGSRQEIDWITEGVGAIFPEGWEVFASLVEPGERPVEAYARLLRDPDATIRASAAAAWDAWESMHISLDPGWRPGPLHPDARERDVFATLVTHYWANDCFLPGAARIRDRVHELGDLPGVLIHGRRDISGPVSTAWVLHRTWPGSRLVVVEDEGHGGPEQFELTTKAIDAFA